MELIFYRFIAQGPVFYLSALTFFIGGIFYFVYFKSRPFLRLADFFFVLAFALVTYYIVEKWVKTGEPPFKTMFESLVYLVWNFSLVYLVLEKSEKIQFAGGFVSFLNAFILFISGIYSDIIQVNLRPSLQSIWFIPHVVFYFAGYGFLFLGFLMSVFYLFFPERKYLGEAHWSGQRWRDFDEFSYRAILFGFSFLTFGLIVGAVWAKVAWGSPWSWDPKENWALITWFVYLTYLHLRYVRGWRGKKAALISIAGFIVVIVTYMGVNYLPSAQGALHSYQ